MRDSPKTTGIIMPEIGDSRSRSPSCYGNMFIRKQYFGSMELVSPTVEPTGPLQRKVGRFRVEPSHEDESVQIPRSPSLAKLENPEFQTRWYFKFFLGVVHRNFVFLDVNKEPHALSVCLTDVENHAIPQYRAILWQKQGCCRICFPFVPNKSISPREVLRHFGFDKLGSSPREIVSPDVQKEFLVLEEQEGSVYFKFGAIYAKTGQSTDDEMFGNVTGSDEFEDFLHVLGDTIELKGWSGYRGGLDEKDNMTGVNSVYTIFEGHEVMFHVSVMLPYSKGVQQVERKRHIGNDIAVIVFVDGEPDEELAFKPSSIRTKFTHVFAVIRYSKKTKDYWMQVYSEESVPVFGPPLPIPAKFKNPQEFRSFLLTKLMNGEKAAYASPVFSNKRQRTLESLIKGLQTEQWSKPERFGIKRAYQSIHMNQIERKKVFVEVGQALKVNMITLGRAPTSVANVGGLQALKNTPWNTLPVLSSFSRDILCGDSYHNSLIVSCENGISHITDSGTKLIYDSSMSAVQLNVLENYGIFVVRLKKHGRIYAIPLQEIDSDRPFTVCRRQCAKYYLKKSKGSHLYALTRQESTTTLALAVAVGKRVSVYKWAGSRKTSPMAEKVSPAHINIGEFEKQDDFVMNGTPKSLTIVQSHKDRDDLHLCLGFRTRFDVINVQTKEVSILKNFVAYRKSKIVSALDVFDDQNPELLLTYSHTSVFVRLKKGLSEVVTFHWNNAPTNIVCAFPFILGFSENAIEIRLLVNGNLVHTLCVPGIKLITSKANIYFASCKSDNIPTIDRKNKMKLIAPGSQGFSMIRLSDLAGFEFAKNVDREETDLGDYSTRTIPRNIGVYESVKRKDPPPFKRLDNATRSFSSAASLSCPGKDSRKSFSPAHDKNEGCSAGADLSADRPRRNSFTLKARSSVELNKMDGHSVHLTKPNKDFTNNRASIDGSNIPYTRVQSLKDTSINEKTSKNNSQDFPKTSFFYTTRNVVVHTQKTLKNDPPPPPPPSRNSYSPVLETTKVTASSLPRQQSVGQKLIDRRTRPASVKSLPEKTTLERGAADKKTEGSYNPNERHSTIVNRKNDPPDYNLSVNYSTSTYPFHKKTTIV